MHASAHPLCTATTHQTALSDQRAKSAGCRMAARICAASSASLAPSSSLTGCSLHPMTPLLLPSPAQSLAQTRPSSPTVAPPASAEEAAAAVSQAVLVRVTRRSRGDRGARSAVRCAYCTALCSRRASPSSCVERPGKPRARQSRGLGRNCKGLRCRVQAKADTGRAVNRRKLISRPGCCVGALYGVAPVELLPHRHHATRTALD